MATLNLTQILIVCRLTTIKQDKSFTNYNLDCLVNNVALLPNIERGYNELDISTLEE